MCGLTVESSALQLNPSVQEAHSPRWLPLSVCHKHLASHGHPLSMRCTQGSRVSTPSLCGMPLVPCGPCCVLVEDDHLSGVHHDAEPQLFGSGSTSPPPPLWNF